MDDAITAALATARTIELTTIGRRSGLPRRIEIWIYRASGRFYLTGMPGRRQWLANLEADPALVVHLMHTVRADLPATAVPVTEPAERARILTEIVADMNATNGRGESIDPASWIAGSPLVELRFD